VSRPASRLNFARQELTDKIQAVHQENRQVCGSPHICRVLKAQGQAVCENTVEKVMKRDEIRAKPRDSSLPAQSILSMAGLPQATSLD
jgi:hypothetical protein